MDRSRHNACLTRDDTLPFTNPPSTTLTQNHPKDPQDGGKTSQQDSSVPAQSNFCAPIDDRFWRRHLDGTLPVLLRAANVRAGERLPEMAWGAGQLVRRALETFPEIQWAGTDIASPMTAQAPRTFDDTQPVRFDCDPRTSFSSRICSRWSRAVIFFNPHIGGPCGPPDLLCVLLQS